MSSNYVWVCPKCNKSDFYVVKEDKIIGGYGIAKELDTSLENDPLVGMMRNSKISRSVKKCSRCDISLEKRQTRIGQENEKTQWKILGTVFLSLLGVLLILALIDFVDLKKINSYMNSRSDDYKTFQNCKIEAENLNTLGTKSENFSTRLCRGKLISECLTEQPKLNEIIFTLEPDFVNKMYSEKYQTVLQNVGSTIFSQNIDNFEVWNKNEARCVSKWMKQM